MSKERWGVIRALGRLAFRNGVTIFGAGMVTASAAAIIFLLALGSVIDAPYIGLITFLLLPGFFVLGLLLIPLGHLFARSHPGEDGDRFVIDFRKPRTRQTAALVLFLTLVNVFLISAVTYEGVRYTESVEFCGEVCHTVMQPEYTAYLGSPHASVTCSECHVGHGASNFVQAKVTGMGQLMGVLFDSYQRPIPTPVEHLRPAQETCEKCHWPEKFSGDRLKIITKYDEDEANTKLTTALLMHLGGPTVQGKGIHNWHIDPSKTTLYLPASPDRQEISLVRVKHADGRVQNYVPEGFETDPSTISDDQLKRMDCIDCHNRPTHIYQLPAEAMNEALQFGQIDNTLPYIRKLGVEALVGAEGVPDPEAFIRQHILGYYEANNLDLVETRRETIQTAIGKVQDMFRRNVFPEMNLGWGNYPDNISHIDWPGCFRCHDDSHKTLEGDVISQDCTACHQVLAWDEPNPEILSTLGLP